jgi:hypothetical protein
MASIAGSVGKDARASRRIVVDAIGAPRTLRASIWGRCCS